MTDKKLLLKILGAICTIIIGALGWMLIYQINLNNTLDQRLDSDDTAIQLLQQDVKELQANQPIIWQAINSSRNKR